MLKQLSLFEENYPEGFAYYPEFITLEEERQLLLFMKKLSWNEFKMYGVSAKRKIIHFGVGYEFMTKSITPAPAPPEELNFLTLKAAQVLNVGLEDMKEILLTYYPKGSQIGWHYDAPAFEDLIGVSLAGHSLLKLREGEDNKANIINTVLEPRSCYSIRGIARWKWQHHIPPVSEDRYSITFRTLKV
jgi:alkylated DNA repair protein (DNA oxidative demethylase)